MVPASPGSELSKHYVPPAVRCQSPLAPPRALAAIVDPLPSVGCSTRHLALQTQRNNHLRR
jgi:hypothetical protein